MNYRDIDNTGLRVSELCLGTMTFGTPVAEKEASEILHFAVDNGVNFIDTANIYEGYTRYVGSAGGVSEEIIGRALKEIRSQVVIATKVGMKVGPEKDDQGLSRTHILREIDRSLSRLACETVDIYYMHKPDPDTPLEESVQTFDDLIRAGKIRNWGVSNFSSSELSDLLLVCDRGGYRKPVVIQPPYSLLKRDVEKDLLPLCEQRGIAVVPYQVLQGGLLTGKYHRNTPIPENSRQKEKPEWTIPLDDELFDRLEALEKEAAHYGRSLLEHALKTLLDHPPVVSVVAGVKNISQLETLIKAVS